MAAGTPSNAEVMAKMEALRAWVQAVADDTREARDAALRTEAILNAQNIPAQIATLRGDVEKSEQGLRADLVNAITHTRDDISKLGDRVKVLETARNRSDGATGLVGWIARYMPWLITAALGLMAGLGLKDRIPH